MINEIEVNEKEEEEFVDFTNKSEAEKEEEKKQYKNKVVFMRKSIAGDHLYAFDNDGAFAEAIEGSIIMNIAELNGLLTGNFDFIKVSIMPKKER